MKKIFIILMALSLTACYRRLGDLTLIANRNVDSKTDYKLIQRNVIATVKSKKGDPLENVVDKAVGKAKGGEFLKNVRIYVKLNGKKVKVEGDVWGIPEINADVNKSVTADVKFEVGDSVSYKGTLGKIEEGVILGVNQTNAVIQCKNVFGKTVKKEMEYTKLTKIGK